jgi:cyclic di-GMP phosphodiesterase
MVRAKFTEDCLPLVKVSISPGDSKTGILYSVGISSDVREIVASSGSLGSVGTVRTLGAAAARAGLARSVGEAGEAAAPVLVVDDEETVRHLLSLVVTRAGGRPVAAETAQRARDLLEEGRYDVAVLDKNLPDGSGLKLLADIRAQHPDTEVLIVTGYANTESAIEALRLGAFDYIVKPFDVAGVTHRVKLALERQRMQRELAATTAELRRANVSLAESREEVKRAYLETVLRLSHAAKLKDAVAEQHVARVSRYAGILARAVNATDQWVEDMVYAAPLHDIGMISISDDILSRPGPLTASERKTINGHVAVGAQILAGATADVLVLAREIVLTHHERWDGGGYPSGLAGPDIPLSGRIVAVADVWDAVSTDRCYRKALPDELAIAEISSGSGKAFDPTLVEAFLDRLPQLLAVRDESR